MEPSPKPADTLSSAAPKKRGKGMMIAIAAIVLIVIVVAGLYFTGYLGGQAANISIVDDGKCTPTGDAACKFDPATFSTTSGKSVTWKNNGGVDHTVHFFANSTAARPSNSTTLGPGATFAPTFSAAGTYYYYCSIHAWMKGTVTVT
jgi:plastocyanin